MHGVRERRLGRDEVTDDRVDDQATALQVGRADDVAERDADRFADGLMQDLAQRPMSVQRRSTGVDELGGSFVDRDIESRIHSASGGRCLPGDVQRSAEARSGRDLSGVRIHTGSQAAELSDSLQATAFTVGSNVFMGADAARPGTAAGNAVLSHELGHVVQQGGGVARRSVQRLARLAPLHSGAQTVQRLLGMGKKHKKPEPTSSAVAKQVAATAGSARSTGTLTMGELRDHIITLESAMHALVKAHQRGNAETQDAAFQLRTAAERILGSLPDQKSKSSAMLGRLYPEQVKRLQRIIDEMQLIWDEHLVEMTRRKAGNIYMRDGAKDAGDKGAMAHLGFGARVGGFADLGARPATQADVDMTKFVPGFLSTPESYLAGKQASHDQYTGIRATGKSLGLSSAETAAIVTFSSSDYNYINPATANNMAWMSGANVANDLIDKADRTPEEEQKLADSLQAAGITKQQRLDQRRAELLQLREEGALHAGMAVQGLLKLPVWKGTLYRGEAMKKGDFDQRFPLTGASAKLYETMLQAKATEDAAEEAGNTDGSVAPAPDGKDKKSRNPMNRLTSKKPKAATKYDPNVTYSYRSASPTFKRSTIASASKNRSIASGFIGIGGAKVPAPKVGLLWEMDVINGRDIEPISLATKEEEVATLPGAEFKITEITGQKEFPGFRDEAVLIKCKQVK